MNSYEPGGKASLASLNWCLCLSENVLSVFQAIGALFGRSPVSAQEGDYLHAAPKTRVGLALERTPTAT